jgi:ABC-type transport system involved in multi-copper enzyme maturation permease subunit
LNVVFVNDLRKSLFRRKPVLAFGLVAAGILVLTLAVSVLIPSAGTFSASDFPLYRFPDFILPLLAPMFAASAFAKEHEQRTWQDVLLTRLTAGEILRGKFLSSYLPTLVALVVLCPPFMLLLIILGMDWAMDPGLWMLVIGMKFLISVAFYVSVVLVCSYHSPNARVALVLGYCSLAVFGILNFAFWRFLIQPLFFSIDPWSDPNAYTPTHWGSASKSEFRLESVDYLLLLQSILLAVALVGYLGLRLRERRE